VIGHYGFQGKPPAFLKRPVAIIGPGVVDGHLLLLFRFIHFATALAANVKETKKRTRLRNYPKTDVNRLAAVFYTLVTFGKEARDG